MCQAQLCLCRLLSPSGSGQHTEVPSLPKVTAGKGAAKARTRAGAAPALKDFPLKNVHLITRLIVPSNVESEHLSCVSLKTSVCLCAWPTVTIPRPRKVCCSHNRPSLEERGSPGGAAPLHHLLTSLPSKAFHFPQLVTLLCNVGKSTEGPGTDVLSRVLNLQSSCSSLDLHLISWLLRK